LYWGSYYSIVWLCQDLRQLLLNTLLEFNLLLLLILCIIISVIIRLLTLSDIIMSLIIRLLSILWDRNIELWSYFIDLNNQSLSPWWRPTWAPVLNCINYNLSFSWIVPFVFILNKFVLLVLRLWELLHFLSCSNISLILLFFK